MNSLRLGNVEITYLKHAGFKIKGSKVLYIDPYEVPEGLEKADLILVTHDHFDHLDIKSIKRLSKADTSIVTPKGCFVEGYDTCSLDEGEERIVKDVKIKTVPAYNVNKPFHKKGGVGYIVEIDGVRIYHAGDTDRIPEMKNIEVDVALLPIGGTYTMNVSEAVEAAWDIKAKVYIPMHYGAIPNTKADPEEFRLRVPKAVVLKPLLR
ncbi:MAG: MBL fold metallo-hydrolase [Archaeoglobaceae archaeon]|uniref:MBL fold metallo-hydrolase n=1 Tax=Archaeoglobus fulgidus TaxID=2234 RepID=A0A7J3M495_ARCFL